MPSNGILPARLAAGLCDTHDALADGSGVSMGKACERCLGPIMISVFALSSVSVRKVEELPWQASIVELIFSCPSPGVP